jgi:hypothetical protein
MFAIVLLACAGGVVAVNATVLGPGGFVQAYLDALARGDARSALGMPGVTVPEGADPALLVDDTLADLTDVRQIRDVEEDGIHRITVAWTSPFGERETMFAVERVGARFGLFSAWRFAATPVVVVEVTALHDERFTVNGVAARSGVAASEPVPFAVLAPGAYLFAHDSEFLTAEPVALLAAQPGVPLEVAVDVRAGERFVEQVSLEVNEHLDDCATQDVLFPSSCPLGHAIANRVVGTPAWSIVSYPEIVIEPGEEFGTWDVLPATAVAHLTVEVQSLFDGTVTTFDEDIPVEVRYLATIVSESELLIVAQY